MKHINIQEWVEQISRDSFKKPFHHKAMFNPRLRTTGGRYLLRSHNLEFNPTQLQMFGEDEFAKIIKHELCHYHLHIEGRGYRHQDLDFKKLLKEVEGSRYCQLIPGAKRESKWRYTYRCKSCGLNYIRKRRIDLRRFGCGQCGGRLQLVSKQEVR